MSVKSRSPEAQARRTCKSKKVYASLFQAAAAQGFYWLNNKILLSAYECDVCGKYHLHGIREKKVAGAA